MQNYNEKMFELGSKRSVIREIFEYGNQRRSEIGADKVYDFSLGNPNVAPPDCVKEQLINLLNEKNPMALHGYTSAQGDPAVRQAIAEYYNKCYNAGVDKDNFYMTVGAAASLSISLNAVLNEGQEVITFAPFFPEYSVFTAKAGGKLVALQPLSDFQIDLELLEKSINSNTKAILINSPNNPSGVVIKKENLMAMCDILEKKSAQYGHIIYLISDEPYRELVYSDVEVPSLVNLYANTIICYSYSKTLSLPGERIGYILVSPKMQDWKNVYLACCGAGRALGYVCAPSMFQKLVARCQGEISDISIYKTNRDILYNALTDYGFECIKPDGAFYLFVKSPLKDAISFYEMAKKYDLLIVPSDSFGIQGYVRISYCVSTQQIENSLPAFQKLAQEIKSL